MSVGTFLPVITASKLYWIPQEMPFGCSMLRGSCYLLISGYEELLELREDELRQLSVDDLQTHVKEHF